MDAASARVALRLEEAGLPAERRSEREWVVSVPSTRRGPLAVGLEVGERTLVLRAFVIRGPDRNREEVYRRLLRKHLETRLWRFALDDAGDVFAVADVPLEGLTAAALDGILGLLAVYVDETYEGVLRTGFGAGAPSSPPGGS
jgi:hypothetical protein